MHYNGKIKKRAILVSTLIFTLLVYSIVKNVIPAAAENDSTSNKKTILIDVGHGGYDGGAEGKSGTKEKDVNLKISLKLRDSLIEKGYNVIMTRDTDKALLDEDKKTTRKKAQDIANRCKIKEQSQADLFISIHQNHFPQGKYYGAQVWYSNNNKSQSLAHIMQENLKIDLNHDNKRVEKPAKNDYKILSCNDTMPSVLVECGFLSNYEEEQRLLSEEYQQKIVDSLVKSINMYFSKIENL
ncbi:N-acetylmuramoyl-L-alanine amidase CwlD [Clostridium sp. SYSU_GA19001]|uniref:N-acetylmuramoyl-L-alanine amidase CwlD n=1 Tax=Clostridium caldaquaticum TaxID=2940653 RepID=UPI002076EFE0|nr:N-acetylmuramoyl-L-alanine amidase CwlD [Clostridium caldaquaticum]MCM8710761.1 N-acetylmuramoyl-L-alanine amidase CwlD [Clostridium caldaquaticum]